MSRKKVTHVHTYRPGIGGGVANSTLCGRVRNGGDYNIADDARSATCSFCKAIMETGNEKRLRFVGLSYEDVELIANESRRSI